MLYFKKFFCTLTEVFSTGVVKTVFQKSRRAVSGNSPSKNGNLFTFVTDFGEKSDFGVFITVAALSRGRYWGKYFGKVDFPNKFRISRQ